MNFVSMSELLQSAQQAKQNAYCKYSGFAVGAALLTDSGEIFTGCNIENASYGLTICAERIAFGKAISEQYKNYKAIAICGSNVKQPCFPCGACLQFMSEFCDDDFLIVLSDTTYTLKELFPKRFSL